MTTINATYKTKLIHEIKALIQSKMMALDHEIKSLQDDQQADTKSSAGDKFETSREMLQLEINQRAQARGAFAAQVQLLERFAAYKHSTRVNEGSLVLTTDGLYFLGIGLGRVQIADGEVFCVSRNSPVGRILLGKLPGDKLILQNREQVIKQVC